MAVLLLFAASLAGQDDDFYYSISSGKMDELWEKVPHDDNQDFRYASILSEDGTPTGFIVGTEKIEKFIPALPKKDKVTEIRYGSSPEWTEVKPFFILKEKKEIDLIYEIFERFSSKRIIEKKFYRITEDSKIEEVRIVNDDPEISMHLCTNGFYFFSGKEVLKRIYMTSGLDS